MNSERTKSALRFARQNPQCKITHPNYVLSLLNQAKSGRVVIDVDGYRHASKVLRAAGYSKLNLAASGNCLTVFVERSKVGEIVVTWGEKWEPIINLVPKFEITL